MVTLSKFRKVILISSILFIGLTLTPAVKATTISDIFPAALPNYAYGGWQGPFGDGTAGRLFATADGTGIYADATYNGLVWALGSTPEFPSVDLTMQVKNLYRDVTSDAVSDHLLIIQSL